MEMSSDKSFAGGECTITIIDSAKRMSEETVF